MAINEKVRSAAEIMKSEATLGEFGVVEFSPETLSKALEGSEFTPQQFQAMHEQRDVLMAAQGLAVGELGLQGFVKDPELKQVSGTLKLGNDAINAVFYRDRSLPTGEGGTRVVNGVLSMNYRSSGQTGSKEPLKSVKHHLAEETKRLLAK